MFPTTYWGCVSYYIVSFCFLLHRDFMFLTTQGCFVCYYSVRLFFLLHSEVMFLTIQWGLFLTTQGGYVSYYTGRLCFLLHRDVMFLTTQGCYVSYYTVRLCFLLHSEVMFFTTLVCYVSYYTGMLCFLLHSEVMFLTTRGGYVSYYTGRLGFYLCLYCHPLPDSSFKLVIIIIMPWSFLTALAKHLSPSQLCLELSSSRCVSFQFFFKYYTMAVPVTVHMVDGRLHLVDLHIPLLLVHCVSYHWFCVLGRCTGVLRTMTYVWAITILSSAPSCRSSFCWMDTGWSWAWGDSNPSPSNP
jgi:hypothetical protein